MSQIQTECVLVVPTALFHRLGHFQGFSHEVGRYLDVLLGGTHCTYRPRSEVEQDPSFKQLIPYVILRYRDPLGRTLLFQYTRGTGQGEQRLHRKKSIGIGGHISAGDCRDVLTGTGAGDSAHAAAYEEGMRRELAEEIAIGCDYAPRCVGLINDDLSEVGRVHLGVVHVFDLERPAARPLEPDIAEADFREVEAILADVEHFESWSQICLRALFGADATVAP